MTLEPGEQLASGRVPDTERGVRHGRHYPPVVTRPGRHRNPATQQQLQHGAIADPRSGSEGKKLISRFQTFLDCLTFTIKWPNKND